MDRDYFSAEILRAHVRVEDCILQFMTKEETVDFNATAHNMEPNLTKAAWEQREKFHGEFFRNYYTRLEVMRGIRRLNSELKSQAEKMQHELMVEMMQLTPNQHVDSQSSLVDGFFKTIGSAASSLLMTSFLVVERI